MARKKPEPKPFFATRIDFTESMENMSSKLLILMSAIDSALSLDLVQEPAKSILKEKYDDLRLALMRDE